MAKSNSLSKSKSSAVSAGQKVAKNSKKTDTRRPSKPGFSSLKKSSGGRPATHVSSSSPSKNPPRRRPPPSQRFGLGEKNSGGAEGGSAATGGEAGKGGVLGSVPSGQKKRRKASKARRLRNKRRRRAAAGSALSDEAYAKVPKSLVVGRGLPAGLSAQQLMQDLRGVMLPWCSKKLKTKKKQSVKDFIAVAGPLCLTHLQIVTQTAFKRVEGEDSQRRVLEEEQDGEGNVSPIHRLPPGSRVYWRVCGLPNGPTLTFQILEYCTVADIRNSQKRPRVFSSCYKSSPLAVLNGFNIKTEEEKKEGSVAALDITKAILSNLFPQLDVQSIELGDCQRVVMFSHATSPSSHQTLRDHTEGPVSSPTGGRREKGRGMNPDGMTNDWRDLSTGHYIEFRHYAIARRGVLDTSRTVKKLVSSSAIPRRLPDLGNTSDLSEYVLYNKKRVDDGYATSDSEMEDAVMEMDQWTTKREKTADVDKRGRQKGKENTNAGTKNDGEEVEGGGAANDASSKVGIRLVELGPRMFLRLVKIEEEVCAGAVIYRGWKNAEMEAAGKVDN